MTDMLDINHLKILHAIFETGSISKASAVLEVTPSAVSQSLAKIRKLLNDPVFLWREREMQPTQLTSSLISKTLPLQLELEEILNNYMLSKHKDSNYRDSLKIIAHDAFNFLILQDALKFSGFEKIDFHAFGPSKTLEDDLMKLRLRKADILFTTAPVSNQTYISQKIIESGYCIVSKKGYSKYNEQTSDENKNFKIVISPLESCYQSKNHPFDILKNLKNKPDIYFYNESVMMRYCMVSMGGSLLLSPNVIAKKMEKIFDVECTTIPFSKECTVSVYAVVYKPLKNDVIINKFLNAMTNAHVAC